MSVGSPLCCLPTPHASPAKTQAALIAAVLLLYCAQVGALRDALAIVAPATDNSGGSSSSDTAMPPPNSSSGSSSNTSTPPATTSNGAGSGSASSPSYALRSLTVENVPHNEQVSVAGLSCNLEDHITQLPAQIIQLTTPLPGQYNKGGKVVCALNASHEGYLRDLAAGLPQLLALTVLSPYEGREEVFEGFEKLQELHCELGDAFRWEFGRVPAGSTAPK